jgi:hypothetical protein
MDDPRPTAGRATRALGLIAVLIMASIVWPLAGSGSDRGGAQWTGSGRVCDFNSKCSDKFQCRENGRIVEIYLPYGSFATGNQGWEWRNDDGGRCGSADNPVATSPIVPARRDPAVVENPGGDLQDNSGCDTWLAATQAERLAFVRKTVGSINPRLRRDGLTALCRDRQEHSSTVVGPIGQHLRGVAKSAPDPVVGDRSQYPTLDPTDAHQCMARMGEITSNDPEDWPPKDCVAMGY